MGIEILEKERIFCLTGKSVCYVIGVNEFGYPECLHFGLPLPLGELAKLRNPRLVRGHSVSLPGTADRDADPSQMLMEVGGCNSGDYREPSLALTVADGSRITDFRYAGFQIVGERNCRQMPRAGGGETLELFLMDPVSRIRLVLQYTVYPDTGVIVRTARIDNQSRDTVTLDRAYSFNLDLCNDRYDLICLCGAQLRERSIVRTQLVPGIHRIDSKRGVSSAQRNPFVCLCDRHADENAGAAYGVTLLYSGSFALNVELDECDHVRINGGINDFGFMWRLGPGESFETPDCVIAFSKEGFSGMSRAFHDFFRQHYMDPGQVFRHHPIVINNWEATYFDFDEDKLKRFVDRVKGTGMDLLVLDDGWFGKRNDDRSSLGDWFVNKSKLPHGLKGICDYCRAKGMKLGLWFEPEMISENSDLFRAHPDWCIHAPGRKSCVGRDQLVLDMTRTDVCQYLKDVLSQHIEALDLAYIKWDMNRSITEFYSPTLPAERAREFFHRYVLGLYDVLRYLREKYPHTVIESCASGGCRFDGGMLGYSSQIWTSDNTDALSRASIQYGTSYVYPLSAMSCHVSACPNAQSGRVIDLADRFHIASLGTFGYELDPGSLTDEELARLSEFNEQYRQDEDLVLKGDVYRLANPFEENLFAMMLVSRDREKAKLVVMVPVCQPNGTIRKLKLPGLDRRRTYSVRETGQQFSGELLASYGLVLPGLRGDYKTVVYHFKAV